MAHGCPRLFQAAHSSSADDFMIRTGQVRCCPRFSRRPRFRSPRCAAIQVAWPPRAGRLRWTRACGWVAVRPGPLHRGGGSIRSSSLDGGPIAAERENTRPPGTRVFGSRGSAGSRRAPGCSSRFFPDARAGRRRIECALRAVALLSRETTKSWRCRGCFRGSGPARCRELVATMFFIGHSCPALAAINEVLIEKCWLRSAG